MASAMAHEVLESDVLLGTDADSPAGPHDEEELRELQFQGLWARVELEALFAAGLVGH